MVALLVATIGYVNVVYGQGQNYELVRVDVGDVKLIDVGAAATAYDDFTQSYPPPGDQFSEGYVGAEFSANADPTAIHSHGESDAAVTGVASAYINAGWNETEYTPNSTVGVGAAMAVHSAQNNIGDPYSSSSAWASFDVTADARGRFELQPLVPSNPNMRPVQYGAMHVIIVAPTLPFKIAGGNEGYISQFSVESATSYLSGEYVGDSWFVRGNLASLDNGSVLVNEYWPPSINTAALVADELTVGNSYDVTSYLKFWVYGTAMEIGPYTDGTDIPTGSIAAWFEVEAEDAGTPSNFTASYAYDLGPEETDWRIDVPDPQFPE